VPDPDTEERIDEIFTDAKLYGQLPSKMEALAFAQEDDSKIYHRYTFVAKDVAEE